MPPVRAYSTALGIFTRALQEQVLTEQKAAGKNVQYIDLYALTLEDALADKKPLPELFLSIGTEDPLLSDNRSYHEFLEKNGVAHVYEEHSGGHTWEYWDGHLPDVLDWLQGQYGSTASKEV